jgi:hypothetical protein
VAASILERAKVELGDEYDSRAAKFALAVQGPLSGLVPDGERRSAVRNFLVPAFAEPPERIAWALRREANPTCGGLERVT